MSQESRVRPDFSAKIKANDWVRKIGQGGIDSMKLSVSDLCRKCSESIKSEIPPVTMKMLLKANGLRGYVSVNANRSNNIYTALAARVDRIERACREAGVEIPTE